MYRNIYSFDLLESGVYAEYVYFYSQNAWVKMKLFIWKKKWIPVTGKCTGNGVTEPRVFHW